MALKGCDISVYQGDLNFDALKNDAQFVIIRSSRGCPDPGQSDSSYMDKKFIRNRDEARRVGLLRGFYHYAYPQYNSPENEADYFSRVFGTPGEGEVLCLDFEESYGDPVGWCKAFLDRLSAIYNGYKPLLYINLALARAHDWSPVVNSNYGLWLARWDYNISAAQPDTPWPFAAIRQYSNKETFAGVNPIDGDVFYGDEAAFNKYGYHAPTTPPPAQDPRDAQIIELRGQIEQLNRTIADLTAKAAEVDSLRVANSQLQTSVSEKESEISKLKIKVSDLDKNITDATTADQVEDKQYEDQISKLNETIEAYKVAQSNSAKTFEDLTDQIMAKDKEIAELQKQSVNNVLKAIAAFIAKIFKK